MFQIIKGTRDSLGLKDPFDPVASSNAAMEYLQRLKKMFNGDEDKAILAYHAGPGNVLKYGLDTSKMPKAVVRDYLPKILKNIDKNYTYSSDNSYSAPESTVASDTSSFDNTKDYKSGYNLNIPQTLDEADSSSDLAQHNATSSTTTSLPEVPNGNGGVDKDYKSGYNLNIPQTLDENGEQNGNSNNINTINNNISNNVSSNTNMSDTNQLVNSGNINTNTQEQTQPAPITFAQPNNVQQPVNIANPSSNIPIGQNQAQVQQENLRNYDPNAIPGNPVRTLDQQLFDRFSSIPEDQQVGFYQSLDQGNKSLLLSAIEKNIGDNPEVDHPGMFRNFVQGALNRGNEVGRSLNALVARGVSAGANSIGWDDLGQGAENFANQISKDQSRYEAIKQLNDAANPSYTRTAGELATDIGMTAALPVAGATGGLAVKTAKYALSGAAYNTLTAPTVAYNNEDYLREKMKDATVGALFGAAGGHAGDAATKYISRKFGDFIPTKSKELQAWAKQNGINMSAFAFPEVRKDLINFLTANGRNPKVAKIIEDAGDEIVDYNKKFGNQFGDYFTDSAGAVTTPELYIKDTFPNVYKRLGEFNNGANSTVPYGTTIDKLMNNLSAPKSTEDVFSSLAQLNMINRRIVSNDLYTKAEKPLSKFNFSSDDIKSKLTSALDFEYSNGNSATRNTIKKIIGEIPDGDSISALKIANINKLLGEVSNSDAVKGSTAQPLYVKASNELDNYLKNAAINNDRFAPVLSKYNDAKMYNKNVVQDLQKDNLSDMVFNKDLANIEKMTRSSDLTALNNVWGNLDTASQKSLQNYVVSSITSKASKSGELNPMVYAKQIDNLLESKMGQVVFKAHKEDLQNIAELSRNINTNLTKAVQNGSLTKDALSKLKEIAGTSGNLALLGGGSVATMGLGTPAALATAGVAIALPMFLRNNTSKILASKELRNELFEITKNTKGGEIAGEALANFIRNVSNSTEQDATSQNRVSPNNNALELQNLSRQRSNVNTTVDFNANNPNINSSSNAQGIDALMKLRESRGIK